MHEKFHLNQLKYIKSLLAKTGLQSKRPLNTPMSSTYVLSKYTGDSLIGLHCFEVLLELYSIMLSQDLK